MAPVTDVETVFKAKLAPMVLLDKDSAAEDLPACQMVMEGLVPGKAKTVNLPKVSGVASVASPDKICRFSAN